MRPAIAPAQLLAQHGKDTVDLALVQILASSPAPRGEKKWRVIGTVNRQVTL
jgi:hypothetical protein